MFKTIFILLSILPIINCACSDPNKVKLCYNLYLETYELATSPFPTYRAYKMVREMFLVEKGPVGQTLACNYTNTLTSCIGDALESSCITSDQFGGYFNITEPGDATNYVQDYFMMKYTCNQGYDDAMKYFYCLEQVGLYETENLMNCTTQEQQGLGNNGGCPVYDNFITCMSNIYTNYCGNDLRNYICNLETAGITAADPTCKGKLQDCSKPAPGSKFFSENTPESSLLRVRKAYNLLKNGRSVFP